MIKTLIVMVFAIIMSISSVFAQNVLWKKNFGGIYNDAFSAITTVSDGFVAVGNSDWKTTNVNYNHGDWSQIFGHGNIDATIVKFNNNGDALWKKSFGGSYSDYYTSVTAVSDGIVAVGYSSQGSIGGFNGSSGNGDWVGITGHGKDDAIIVKYDDWGNVLWKKHFGGSGDDYFLSVTTGSDGIVVTGYSQSISFGTGDWEDIIGNGGERDAIIVKYDNNGNVLWKKNFGGNGWDEYVSVTAVSNGVIVVGYSDAFGTGDWEGVIGKSEWGNAIIVKYDNAGNVSWKKNFGGNGKNAYFSVIAVSDGIIAAGHSELFGTGDWIGIVGKGNNDAIIVKYDNDGNVLWKKNFGGSNGDFFHALTAVSNGIVAVGYSYPESFNSGDWVGIMSKGGCDAIIVKYDNAGNIEWKKNFGGSGWDEYSAVTAISDGIITVGNSSLNSFNNDDWQGIIGKGEDDAIIVKYTNNSTGITDISEISQIKIYPNPTSDKFVIESDKVVSIKLYDMLGKEVLSQNTNDKTEININHLPKGIYSINVISESRVIGHSKIVKQ